MHGVLTTVSTVNISSLSASTRLRRSNITPFPQRYCRIPLLPRPSSSVVSSADELSPSYAHSRPLPHTSTHRFSNASTILSATRGRTACEAIRCNGLAKAKARSMLSSVGPWCGEAGVVELGVREVDEEDAEEEVEGD